jgi:hypothetical protein
MENTACGCECPFVKQGFCASDKECPNYVESWFVERNSSEQRLIKDCSPKRMLLQQQVLQVRFEGVQQALEQARNEYINLGQYLRKLIEASKQVLEKKDEIITIDDCRNPFE